MRGSGGRSRSRSIEEAPVGVDSKTTAPPPSPPRMVSKTSSAPDLFSETLPTISKSNSAGHIHGSVAGGGQLSRPRPIDLRIDTDSPTQSILARDVGFVGDISVMVTEFNELKRSLKKLVLSCEKMDARIKNIVVRMTETDNARHSPRSPTHRRATTTPDIPSRRRSIEISGSGGTILHLNLNKLGPRSPTSCRPIAQDPANGYVGGEALSPRDIRLVEDPSAIKHDSSHSLDSMLSSPRTPTPSPRDATSIITSLVDGDCDVCARTAKTKCAMCSKSLCGTECFEKHFDASHR